jgi:hypothetical protein
MPNGISQSETLNMIAKYAGFTTLAFLGSFGLALAQSATPSTTDGPPAAPAPMSAATQNALTAGGKVATGAAISQAAPGWYYVHATNCLGYNGYLYVYPSEGGDWYTNNTLFQNVLEPQCSLGNWVAFHVYNTSGNWDEVYTYNYK